MWAQRIVLYKFFEEVSRGRQRNKNYKSYSIDGSVYYIAREEYTRVLHASFACNTYREYCSRVMHSRVANSTLRAVHACNISECSRSRKMCTYTTREQHKYNTRACVTLHLSSTVANCY